MNFIVERNDSKKEREFDYNWKLQISVFSKFLKYSNVELFTFHVQNWNETHYSYWYFQNRCSKNVRKYKQKLKNYEITRDPQNRRKL